MGASVETAVKELWQARRYQEVQFRSVSNGPINGMPHFDEVFMDSGDYDMYKVMKVLVDNDYDGYLHLDHTPEVAGNPYTYAAYAAGFMRACIRRAQNEPKGTT